MTKPQVAIWWVKRDFRLSDNKAFSAALAQYKLVIPLYVWEDVVVLADDFSSFHHQAISQALTELRTRLAEIGSALLVHHGSITAALDLLDQRFELTEIFAHQETGFRNTYQRDISVKRWCEKNNVGCTELLQQGVFRRLQDRDHRVRLWTKFIDAPLAPKIKAAPLTPDILSFIGDQNQQIPPPVHPHPARLQAISESAAETTLSSFLYKRGKLYSGGISSPNSAFIHGSRLSVHLCWGTISLSRVYQAVAERNLALKADSSADSKQWRKSLRAMTSRLHWHDHFIQRLETEPEIEFKAIHAAYHNLPYNDDPAVLERFLLGQTGVPLIDACMRCLQHCGFLNFRMRAMIVSYACHALHLSWQSINYPLAKLFLDYEPGIHVSQIQMQAGVVGFNTVRVYNPAKQLLDQDPEAKFVKTWVPELTNHSVAEMTTNAGEPEEPVRDYFKPMVSFKENTKRMRTLLYDLRKADPNETARVLDLHGSRRKRR